MSRRKLITIVVKCVGGMLLLIIAIFAISLFILYNGDVEVKRFSSLPSSDNSYFLNIDIANPSMPYGSHTIEITVSNTSNETMLTGRFRLSNDGANVSSKNIESRWIDNDTAEVCLRGDEQIDGLVSIRVSSQNILEKKTDC